MVCHVKTKSPLTEKRYILPITSTVTRRTQLTLGNVGVRSKSRTYSYCEFTRWTLKTAIWIFVALRTFQIVYMIFFFKSRGPCIVSIFLLIYFQQDATLHSLFISGKPLYMFRVVSPLIIRSIHNCTYSTWYLSNRYCYLPLLWKSWNWFECGVGIVL